ncbi:MAG TPA: phenylacetate--CoA ligase family protein, partial [Candidatus Eisenbacteria bacterium]
MKVARDAYTLLVARVLFPLHERIKGHPTIARLRELESSQWLPREEVARRQADRLREFLGEVGARVPYYRDLFARARVRPAGIRGASDLASIPVLTKPLIREHAAALAAEGARGLRPASTGGSTGDPLR